MFPECSFKCSEQRLAHLEDAAAFPAQLNEKQRILG
jgi:hypothetical protein